MLELENKNICYKKCGFVVVGNFYVLIYFHMEVTLKL